MANAYKVAVFDEEEKLIGSMKKMIGKGYTIYDVYMPYPIHEVLHLLKRKSRLPTAAYFYGLGGAMAILAFLYYTSVIDWPVVYGGKPFNSFPSFLVITIVLTIFTVTITTLFTFSLRSKLWPGSEHPIFHEEATDDKFILVLNPADFDEAGLDDAVSIALSEGALEVIEKETEK